MTDCICIERLLKPIKNEAIIKAESSRLKIPPVSSIMPFAKARAFLFVKNFPIKKEISLKIIKVPEIILIVLMEDVIAMENEDKKEGGEKDESVFATLLLSE